jgi:hypothetical protein
MKEDERMPSHKNSQGEDYTQLVNEIVEEEDVDDESLMRCSDQHKEMMLDETQESHGFKTNHWCVYAGYEDNHKENEGVENKHSNTMLTDYDEELRLLEEWLISPKDWRRLHSCCRHKVFKNTWYEEKNFEASRGEEELLVFQTNCFSEYVNLRQPEDAELSKGDGGEDKKKLQAAEEIADFEDYSHGLMTSKEWRPRVGISYMESIWRTKQQKAKLDIEIDEPVEANDEEVHMEYHGMKRTVNHKLQLVERDYINKVKWTRSK